MQISNSNIRLQILEDIPFLHVTNLADDVLSGTQTVPVASLELPALGQFYAYMGNHTGSNREVVPVSDTASLSFSGVLKYAHKKYERVSISTVYKVAIYESDSADGTYSKISENEIDWAKPDGVGFEDLDFRTDYFYKIQYIEKNSAGVDQEIWSLDTLKPYQIEGGDRKDVYATIQEVIDETGVQYEGTDSKLVWGYIESAKNYINSYLEGLGNAVPLENPPDTIKFLVRTLASAYLLRKNGNREDYLQKKADVDETLKMIKDGSLVVTGLGQSPRVSYKFEYLDNPLRDISTKW
jgi:hypothetical protein